jgi:hypothetical protein
MSKDGDSSSTGLNAMQMINVLLRANIQMLNQDTSHLDVMYNIWNCAKFATQR